MLKVSKVNVGEVYQGNKNLFNRPFVVTASHDRKDIVKRFRKFFPDCSDVPDEQVYPSVYRIIYVLFEDGSVGSFQNEQIIESIDMDRLPPYTLTIDTLGITFPNKM